MALSFASTPSLPTSIQAAFADLPDPHVERTRAHSLLEVITVALRVVLCGADGRQERVHGARIRMFRA